jgi:hypothetical protein
MTPEDRKAARRAFYAEHREQMVKARREWYAANRETARNYTRKWRMKKGLWKNTGKIVTWSKWDADRIAQLRELRGQGLSHEKCGKLLGCSGKACERACVRYDIHKPDAPPGTDYTLPKHSTQRRETREQSAMWARLLGGATCTR